MSDLPIHEEEISGEDPSEPLTPLHPNHILYPFFPRRQFHIVGGKSKSGKTPLAFQLLHAISKGEPLFGFPTTKSSTCLISLDLYGDDYYVTDSKRAGLDIGPVVRPEMSDFEVDRILDQSGDAEVVFIESALRLVRGSITSHREVANVCDALIRACRSRNITIFGIWSTQKDKGSGGGDDVIDHIAGSMAASAMSYTSAVVSKLVPKNPKDPHRTLSIMPKGQPAEVLNLKFNDLGIFEQYVSTEELSEKHYEDEFYRGLSGLKNRGFPIEFDEIKTLFPDGHPKKAIFARIGKAIDDGELERTTRGWYRRPLIS